MNTYCRFDVSIAGACLVFCLASRALATSITGDINFDGKAKLNTRSLLTASQVNRWKTVDIGIGTGSFAGFAAPESAVAMTTPWVFTSARPFAGLWSLGGFSFDLTSSAVVFRSRNSLDLRGSGTVAGHGFDVTSGDWSVIFTKHRRKVRFWFSFESDRPIAQPPSVPDVGSSALLLGLGIVGLLVVSACSRRIERCALDRHW